MKRATLSKTQKEILLRSAEMVLAGEWPWEHDAKGRRLTDTRQAREAKTLREAADKLRISVYPQEK